MMGKLTKAQARARVQAHWAEFIANSDAPHPCRDEVADVWLDESLRCARRLLTPAGLQALSEGLTDE